MTPEELDQRLQALPAQTAPAATAPEPRPEPAESAVMSAYRAMARQAAAAPTEARSEREQRDASELQRRQRMEGLRAERAKLERRINPRLLERLRGTQTPCALLLGPSGLGKTAAMDWLRVRWPGYFVHVRELASSERRHGLGEGYPPELAAARRAPVLYIDDLGAEEQRDLGTLQELLDHRYRNGLATCATSGLGSAELKAHLGAAYVRRLVDQHVKRSDGSDWPVLVADLFPAALRSVT